MKQIIILCLFFSLGLHTPFSAVAQQKAKAALASVRQHGRTVAFTVTSARKFYVGNDIYVLHIGASDFSYCNQDDSGGSGKLIFFVPKEDYGALKEGAGIYLTYGATGDGPSAAEMCRQGMGKCWPLGTYSKKLLTR